MTEQKQRIPGSGKHGRQGRKKNPLPLIRKPIGLTEYQWERLLSTGNASLTARRILAENGFPEEPITSKT